MYPTPPPLGGKKIPTAVAATALAAMTVGGALCTALAIQLGRFVGLNRMLSYTLSFAILFYLIDVLIRQRRLLLLRSLTIVFFIAFLSLGWRLLRDYGISIFLFGVSIGVIGGLAIVAEDKRRQPGTTSNDH